MPPPDVNSPLHIPTEIPWRLADTTQPLGPFGLGPDNSAISIFTYVPKLDSLDTDYPEDRLIYLKFAVSVAPYFPFNNYPQPSDPLVLFSDEALPVWRLLFDVTISPDPYGTGGITPYFLTAAPLSRAMIETGVVGQQNAQGSSKALSIGKSGSQMNETYSSKVDTDTSSVGVSWPFGGVSSDSSETTTSGARQVTQNVDTTQRDASTERKELVSHMTNVTNVLTLLSTFNVGSPYLRFSLWQRPLQPLTLDPLDPSLWYAELLRRRSSGIEGIQEFYAIACVPRNLLGFCVEAQLRRLSILLPPLPAGKDLEMPGDFRPSSATQAKLVEYLRERYPKGTPVDDLDVELDFFGGPKTKRPVIDDWWSMPEPGADWLFDGSLRTGTVDIGDAGISLPWAPYKTAIEVWLDMKRDEYEKKLLESPLSAGTPHFSLLTLHTCFGPPGDPLKVTKANTDTQPQFSALPSVQSPPFTFYPKGGRKLDLYRRTAFAWNAAENHLSQLLSRTSQLPAIELRFDHPKIVDAALQRLAQLEVDDPANQNLEQAAGWFGLTPTQIAEFRRQGITDSKGLADAINLAPVVDRVNRRYEAMAQLFAHPATGERPPPDSGRAAPSALGPPSTAQVAAPHPIPTILSLEAASILRRSFGASLQASFARQRQRPSGPPPDMPLPDPDLPTPRPTSER